MRVDPRGTVKLPVDAILGHFTDAMNAYRFGPPKADVLVARTGLPAARCVAALTALELAGLVEARWGGELVRR